MVILKRTMVILIIAFGLVVIGTIVFMHTERFGNHPAGQDLTRIKQSPNFRNGSFQNLSKTPMLTEGVGYGKVLYEFLFSSKPKEPRESIPSVKTDLKNLRSDQNVLVWMGHSSYFMQIDGKRILVDPVLSGNASPLSFTTKAYQGTDIYSLEDIPEIDVLFLSHDHWDHMDYNTLKGLRSKIKTVITGLGNGAHLKRWGFSDQNIQEKDWYEGIQLDTKTRVFVTPARHFSGRGFKRAQTLWASFVYSSPNANVYIGGDSGYGKHFKDIGEKYGPFDLAILENGQYDENWKYIHMLPGEQFRAAEDLNAKAVFPVHSGKFTLANHDWQKPLEQIVKRAKTESISVITPKIGEVVVLNDSLQSFENWWENVN